MKWTIIRLCSRRRCSTCHSDTVGSSSSQQTGGVVSLWTFAQLLTVIRKGNCHCYILTNSCGGIWCSGHTQYCIITWCTLTERVSSMCRLWPTHNFPSFMQPAHTEEWIVSELFSFSHFVPEWNTATVSGQTVCKPAPFSPFFNITSAGSCDH